jgi:hypothetical protein
MKTDDGSIINERKIIDWNQILVIIISGLITSVIISMVWFFSLPYRIDDQASEIKAIKAVCDSLKKEDIEVLKQGREENKMKIVALETNQTNILLILKEMQNDIKDLLKRKV